MKKFSLPFTITWKRKDEKPNTGGPETEEGIAADEDVAGSAVLPDEEEDGQEVITRGRDDRAFSLSGIDWQGRGRLYLFIGAGALALIIAAFVLNYIQNRLPYRGVKVASDTEYISESGQQYLTFAGKILKYSGAGVSLMNLEQETIWNHPVRFSAPTASMRGDYVVIWDKLGMEAAVFDKHGLIGTIKAEGPLIAADISEQGSTALVIDDGETAIVKYYTKNGGQIADIAANSKETGYPVDVAVTGDGKMLAVSYVKGDEEGICTNLCFYEMKTGEQNGPVYTEHMEERIVPELFGSGRTIVAMEEDGFTSYRCGRSVTRGDKVTLDQNIQSVFYNGEFAGFIMRGTEGARYRMELYRINGRKECSFEFDLIYDTVTVDSERILLYNGSEMALYNINGRKRFEGVISDGGVQYIYPTGRSRFLAIGNRESKIFVLKLLDTD